MRREWRGGRSESITLGCAFSMIDSESRDRGKEVACNLSYRINFELAFLLGSPQVKAASPSPGSMKF